MKISVITSLMLTAAVAASAAEPIVITPEQKGDNEPTFISVPVDDGNYKVTVTLGAKKRPACTTVRAESRRLMLDRVDTPKGKKVERSFLVNKRNRVIAPGDTVKTKAREARKLNWDDELTLEFNGPAPAVEKVVIEPAADSVVTVFLFGNSTVVDQDNEPWASWGQIIPAYFDEGVCVANYAESGERADTFILSKRLKKALSQMKKGDYAFIEFGHNDQKLKGPGKGGYYFYMTNLKTFVDEIRAKGATPVLVTPTCRRSFNDEGIIVNTHEDYPDAMRWMADKEGVTYIELNGMTKQVYEALGTEGSKAAFVHYPAGTWPGQTADLADNTHFNPYGATQVAKCVLKGITEKVPGLAAHVKGFDGYDPSHPDDPAAFHWDNSPFTEVEKPDGN